MRAAVQAACASSNFARTSSASAASVSASASALAFSSVLPSAASRRDAMLLSASAISFSRSVCSASLLLSASLASLPEAFSCCVSFSRTAICVSAAPVRACRSCSACRQPSRSLRQASRFSCAFARSLDVFAICFSSSSFSALREMMFAVLFLNEPPVMAPAGLICSPSRVT